MSLPQEMFAVIVRDDEERSLAWETVPCPQPGEGEVLVRIHATALNRADLLQRKGLYPPPPGASDVMGLEMAGEVIACGAKVDGWNIGDRVCCLLSGGGYAQYTVCDVRMLLPIPETMSWEEAAALPEVLYTAYLNIYIEAQTQPGDVVLVHAGASGVGTAAIQLCRALGNPVLATASGSKLPTLMELGATATFDRHSGSFVDWVKEHTEGLGAHTILDPVGAGYLADNIKSLRLDGCLVLIGLMSGRESEISLGSLLRKRIRLIGSTLRGRTLDAKVSITDDIKIDVWPLVISGTIKPIIHTTVPIQEVESAHQLLQSNTTTGKVVLRVPSSEFRVPG